MDFDKIKGFFNGVIKLVAKIFELWLADKAATQSSC